MAPSNGEPRPRVVIIGAGSGGLSAATALADSPFDVTLIDQHNYHLFQPLLYQVATAGLSPADIASAMSPTRWVPTASLSQAWHRSPSNKGATSPSSLWRAAAAAHCRHSAIVTLAPWRPSDASEPWRS